MAELADAQDLKSWAWQRACGFDPRPRHFRINKLRIQPFLRNHPRTPHFARHFARELGVSRASVYRYTAESPDFPSALPTLRWVLRNWPARRGIPGKAGPALSPKNSGP